jgi:enolase
MIVPAGFDNFGRVLRAGVECYHALKSVLKAQKLRRPSATKAASLPT